MTPTETDRYDAEWIEKQTSLLPIGHPIDFFQSIDSTNDYARALPPGKCEHGRLVLANHQSAGRGRYDRRWSDVPGGALLFSLILRVERPASFWPLITLGAGVSVCRTLECAAIAETRIRWPNDVLVGGKKVCGILTETGPAPSTVVLGIGLNVHQREEELPPEIADIATSLSIIEPVAWHRADLLVAILKDFAAILDLWNAEQDKEILEACRKRLSTLGRAVKLSNTERSADGVVMDLESDGALVVRESSGIVSRWHSADVRERP